MSDPLPPQPSGEQPSGDGAPADRAAPAAAPRPYTAPSSDAPQYAMPAYAIPPQAAPAPGDARSAQSPGAPPLAHAYATPSYADPGTAPRPGAYAFPTAYAAPPTAYAAPAASPAAAALPPYAHAATPPPSYPGAPSFGTAPAGGSFPPGGIDTRPKGLAVVALALAGAGILVTLVATVVGSAGIGWLAPLLLMVGFVLSLIALISRNQGGKGLGVGALLLSLLGGTVSFIVAVAWIFGSFGSSGSDAGEYDGYDGYTEEEYSLPSIAAPGTDGQPDPGAEFAPPVQPTVAEAAFGREYDDVWWYAVVVDNPNVDYVFDAYVEVHAYAEDGSIIGSAPAYSMLLSGKTALVGYFFDLGDAEIARIDADLPEASQATLSPGTETGSFAVQVDATPAGRDSPTAVTGTASAHFADDQEFVAVTVLARAADGTITAATSTYLETVPGDGTPVAFEAWFEDLPADATVEALAHR